MINEHRLDSASPYRVLIVDDDANTRTVLTTLLKLEGHGADTAVSSEEALCLLREREYDVLLSDHIMPGMSGLELARVAREIHPSLRCVIVSGHARPTTELGPIGWMAKPIDVEELLTALRASP